MYVHLQTFCNTRRLFFPSLPLEPLGVMRIKLVIMAMAFGLKCYIIIANYM